MYLLKVFEIADLIVCLDFNHISRVGKTLESEILNSNSPLILNYHPIEMESLAYI